jgi:hypothetical protein
VKSPCPETFRTLEPSGPPRRWLQDDFVPFEEEDSSSDESFMSFSSIIV